MKSKIPKQVLILSLVSLFTDIASEMLYPVTPIFLTAVIGSSMSVVGAIEGAAEITAGFLKGYFGNLSDKMGRRSIFVIIGYSLSAFSKPLPGIFPRLSSVIVSRITDRVGKGIRTAPRDALLAANSENNTGRIFGFHRAMDTLGAALGPVAALILLHFYENNYSLVFIAAFFPSLIAVTFTFFVKEKRIEVQRKLPLKLMAFWKTAPVEYKSVFVFFTVFSFVNSSDVFLILKSQDITGSSQQAVMGYIFYNLVYAAASYPVGFLSDKLGKKRIFILGLFIFSFVYSGFAFATNSLQVWLLFIFYGIFAASAEGIVKAWISDIIPDQQRGSGIGLISMFSSFALMAGSITTGLLWDTFGPSVPFALSAMVSFILGVMLLFHNVKPLK